MRELRGEAAGVGIWKQAGAIGTTGGDHQAQNERYTAGNHRSDEAHEGWDE
jgi:hypothetical protein